MNNLKRRDIDAMPRVYKRREVAMKGSVEEEM